MSIDIKVLVNGVQVSSGAQYNYTKARLYYSELDYVEFNTTLLNKQSSQYAYTNENPVSILAQTIDGGPVINPLSGLQSDRFMLTSGARNSVETKVFLGPRSRNYTKLVLYDEGSSAEAIFYGDDFESLLNTNPNQFIALTYTETSEGDSFELDLHLDRTTYEDSENYSSLDYLGLPNYPHFNQVKYSNRVVSNDDFLSNSMSIRNTISYTPHLGNYYIRPDFVKAFKGFKILGTNSQDLEIIVANDHVNIESDQIVELGTTRTDLYYDYLIWDYSPKIPGFKLIPSQDTYSAILNIDSSILAQVKLSKREFIVTASNNHGVTASKILYLDHNSDSDTKSATIYVANPSVDSNPWYNIFDYITPYHSNMIGIDTYEISSNTNQLMIDNSNYRFRYVGDWSEDWKDTNNNLLTSATISITYKPYGTGTSIVSNLSIEKCNYPIVRSSMTLTSRFKVSRWIKCKNSSLNISNSTDTTCTLSGSGLASIKAVTLHGVYLYKEVLT